MVVEISGAEGAVPVRIEVADVAVVVEGDPYGDVETRAIVRSATRQATRVTRQIYSEAVEMACSLAGQTQQRLKDMDDEERPDEFEVQFALSFDAELNAKLVTIDAGGLVQVRMQWNRTSSD